jgi:3',5'-cyclic AMP phosphodiesterase CpdA
LRRNRLIRGGIAALLTAAALAGFSTPAAAQTLAFISDVNGRYGSTTYHDRLNTAMARIKALGPDLVISAGDLVAGQKQPELGRQELDAMWRGFDEAVYEPLQEAGIPLLVTPGNHDGSAFPAFASERQRFIEQWQSRAPVGLLPGGEWPLRYGLWLDDVLLLTYDSTIPGRVTENNLAFLRQALEGHAAQARHVVVFSHLPMWPIASGRETEIMDDPALLELLHTHRVSAYVSGHHHAWFAGYDEAGLLHVAVGALGGNSRHYATDEVRQPHSFAVLDLGGAKALPRSYAAPEFTRAVPATALPVEITGPLGKLTRVR